MELNFIFLLFLFSVIVGITRLSKSSWRPIVFATLSMVFLTPLFTSATIFAVLLPFGAIRLIGLAAEAVREIPNLLSSFWQWHTIAFSSTWLICYLFYIFGKKCVVNKLQSA